MIELRHLIKWVQHKDYRVKESTLQIRQRRDPVTLNGSTTEYNWSEWIDVPEVEE